MEIRICPRRFRDADGIVPQNHRGAVSVVGWPYRPVQLEVNYVSSCPFAGVVSSVRCRLEGVMKVITVIAASLAVALSLAGCAKPTATGSYSKTNPNVALLIDLVEAEHGKLSGRMELVTLMADGSVQDRTAAVEGQADGEHLSLTIKPGEFLAQPETISAERNGDELHISGKGLVGSVMRQPLKTFEDGVKAIRAKSAEMIAANTRATPPPSWRQIGRRPMRSDPG